SDVRLKKDIIEIEDPLAKIMELRGVNFTWKWDGRRTMGFIAQEVEQVIPEIVHTDSKTEMKSVEYGNIVALVVEALKEFIHETRQNFKNSDRQIASLQEENAM